MRRWELPTLPQLTTERWIRSAREECLDKLLIINQAHLRRVMRENIAFFNTARPHQGLDQQILGAKMTHGNTGSVGYRAVLGGIVHDYYRDARERRSRLLHEFFETMRLATIPSISRL